MLYQKALSLFEVLTYISWIWHETNRTIHRSEFFLQQHYWLQNVTFPNSLVCTRKLSCAGVIPCESPLAGQSIWHLSPSSASEELTNYLTSCRPGSSMLKLHQDQAHVSSRPEPDNNGSDALQASVYHRERSRLQVSPETLSSSFFCL